MDSKNSSLSSRRSFLSKKQAACPIDPSLPFQVGSLSDINLSNLREVIKNAMIPLLIRVFELKLAAQQAKTPPSRLHRPPKESSGESLEKIQEQLNLLLKDLDLLHLWCESSQKQVAKALKEIEEMQQPASNTPEEKSFSGDFSSDESIPTSLQTKEKGRSSWLRKFFPW